MYLELDGMPREKLLKSTKPILDFIKFHRIVLDEGHEVVSDDFFMRMSKLPHELTTQESISTLKSRYRWYVTGTPFPNLETVYGVLEFLAFQSTEPKLDLAEVAQGNTPFNAYRRYHSRFYSFLCFLDGCSRIF